MAYLRPQRMSDSCMNMCEVWRPPPLPYKTGVDLKVLKTIYADNLAYINYTSCCPGYRYIDGSDISSTTAATSISREVTQPVTFKTQEVANAGLGAGVIALIVILLLAAIIGFVLYVAWKKYYNNNRQSSWAQRFTKYNAINCLDHKDCKLCCWLRMDTPPSQTGHSPPEEIEIIVPYAEVHRTGIKNSSENATTCGNNQTQGRHCIIVCSNVSKGACESGEEKFREDNDIENVQEKARDDTGSESGEEKFREDNDIENWLEKVRDDTDSKSGEEKFREDNAIENGPEKIRDDTGSESGEEKGREDIAIENGGQKVKEDSASKNGGQKGREDTASMKKKQCDKVEGMLTPVENVEADEIDEIQNKGHHKSANDNILRIPPYLIAYNFLNSNKKNVNTPSTSNIHDVLRHSQGVKSNPLPPLDSQSAKHRISDSQVISPKKKKGLFRKSAPDPTG